MRDGPLAQRARLAKIDMLVLGMPASSDRSLLSLVVLVFTAQFCIRLGARIQHSGRQLHRTNGRRPHGTTDEGGGHDPGGLPANRFEPGRSRRRFAHGHDRLPRRGRIFATLASQAQGYGNLVLTPDEQAAFVQELPEMFVPIAGGWGRMGMTHIVLAKPNEDLLRGALQMAWRLRLEANARANKRRARTTGDPPVST